MPVKVVRFAINKKRNEGQETRRDHRAAGSGQAERGSNWLSALPTQ